MRLAGWIAAFGLAAAACDAPAGADAAATLEGTVAGRTIPSPGATGTSARSVVSPASTVVEIAVHVASGGTTCSALAFATAPSLDLRVHVEGANVPAITAGDYSIGQASQGDTLVVAQALFAVGGDAGPAALAAARSGSITFSTISATTIAGRFDLVFVTGDHLTGTFDALACDAGAVTLASDAATDGP